MDELQDNLSRLLEDPAELERLSQMASQLLGGGTEKAESSPPEKNALPDLSAVLSAFRSDENSDTQKLLQAMKPFLAKRRQEKLSRAMRVAKLASMAELALGQMGGEEADESVLR